MATERTLKNQELFKQGKYMSYNKRINKPTGFDVAEFKKVLEEMNEDGGWEEVEPQDVKEGYRVRYLRERDSDLFFVSGGYVRKNNAENKSLTILGKGLSGVFYDDVKKMWQHAPNENREKKEKKEKKEKAPKVVTFKTPTEGEFKFKAMIKDTIVYNTDNKKYYDRFISTGKFKYALETGNFKFI